MEFKNRIRELRNIKASSLMENPLNHRIHPESQRKQLRKVLGEIGFAGAVLAREDESGNIILIDGHMRAKECGESDIPVLILDVNEKEANKILASYDALGAMAEIDKKILDELVGSFSNDNPFSTDGIKEALEPVEDIVEREKKEREKLAKERIEKANKYKNGEEKFGIQKNEWWRVKEGKYLFSGSIKHPLFLRGVSNYESNKKKPKNGYYRVLLNSPQDKPDDYVVDENIMSMCDEVWTFTNNDWGNIKPIIDRGYVKGIYTFADDKNGQIVIFESISRDSPLVPIECGFILGDTGAQGGIKFKSELMPPPTNGSVLVVRAFDKFVGKLRFFMENNGICGVFIAPNVNTGRVFRSLMNGHYVKCYFSEQELGLCESLLANGFKHMGSRVNKEERFDPPRKYEKWA